LPNSRNSLASHGRISSEPYCRINRYCRIHGDHYRINRGRAAL